MGELNQIELSQDDISFLTMSNAWKAFVDDTKVLLAAVDFELTSGISQSQVAISNERTWYLRGLLAAYKWQLSWVENAQANEREREHGDSDNELDG